MRHALCSRRPNSGAWWCVGSVAELLLRGTIYYMYVVRTEIWYTQSGAHCFDVHGAREVVKLKYANEPFNLRSVVLHAPIELSQANMQHY